VSANDIIESGIFTPPEKPRDEWSLGTVSSAPSGGVVNVIPDGDTATTPMCAAVACVQGDQVLTLLLGRTRIVVLVIPAAVS
jgi:predicted RecA/RadA family phage recombinase